MAGRISVSANPGAQPLHLAHELFAGHGGQVVVHCRRPPDFTRVAPDRRPRSLSGVDAVTWRHHLDNGDITRWLPEAIKDPKLAEQVAALVREHLSTDEAPGRVRALIQEQYPRRRSPSRYRDVGQSWPGRVSTASRAPPSRARERRAPDRQIAPRMCQAQAARRAACA